MSGVPALARIMDAAHAGFFLMHFLLLFLNLELTSSTPAGSATRPAPRQQLVGGSRAGDSSSF